ncbi:cell adhesion molecule Dscam1-like isoform X2 [Tachypleus tridentatus]|uniref:cell adhesion molecule Dscam1-like isoform X2 n=1 Tax=Tachypleus tridentatus TaxID=6853 RepID=UPI003FD4E551
MTKVLWILCVLSVADSSELMKRTPSSTIFSLPYLSSSMNFTITAGETIVLDCPLENVERNEISWEKDGRRLPDNQRQRIYPNGSLIISNVNRNKDGGHFECFGSTPSDQVSRVMIVLSVRVPPKINPFSFSSDLYEGSRTAVTCVVVAGDRPIFIKWLKDGRQLTDGDHGASIFVTAEDYVSTLTLDNLSRRFNGNYTCKASNVIGTDSASAYLEVKTPPYWTIPPVDSRAIVGKSIMLHCQAEGYPAPHIRWKVAKGMPPGAYNTIISSSRVYILVNGSLTITSVRKEDEGLYLCEASNGLGQPISSAISLTVHSPPNFRSKFSTQTLQKGERATVPCNSIGEKPIFIQWLKNGKKFSPSDQRRYIYREDPTPEGKLAEITIPSTTRDDSAIYTCIARNEFGEDSMNAQVTIQEVPDIPNNIRVEKITSRDLVLSWSPPYNGNSDITEYNVQWREAHGNWNQITIRGTVTTIENLRPQTLYGFRVREKNALGAGSYSNEIQEKSATEPPQTAPSGVRVVPVTSRTIMVSWLLLKESNTGVDIQGYYVGIKPRGSSETFTYRTVMVRDEDVATQEISGLERDTEYIIVVQAFNSKGSGPPSGEIYVRTPQFDHPPTPVLKISVTTASSITVTWDSSNDPDCPVSEYIIYHKMDNTESWQQSHLSGDKRSYTLQSLNCGATYHLYIEAYNKVGKSEPSQTISTKSDGHAPVAPDKYLFLTTNSTYIVLHLNAWKNGGCPINFFVIQYKQREQVEWTLVSNNILPDQQDLMVTDLTPGMWYTLLASAHNDAGITDAEFVFATLTPSGELPTSPSKMMPGNFLYRHLTVTVPVASSVLVLIVVFIVVCQVTRRRSPGPRTHSPEGTENSEQVKPDNMSLTVTYDSQEPAYLPAPYATTKVPMYSREQVASPKGGSDPGMRTFSSSRHLYDVPNPNRKMESKHFTNGTVINEYQKTAVQEGQNLNRKSRTQGDNRKRDRKRDYEYGSSGNESEEEIRITTNRGRFKEIDHDVIHGSETECDRQWKSVRQSRNHLDDVHVS